MQFYTRIYTAFQHLTSPVQDICRPSCEVCHYGGALLL